MPIRALDHVATKQREWFTVQGIPVNTRGYTTCLGHNLFLSMSDAARAEFQAGDGAELGSDRSPGKMQAVHSSSALVCNIFDYWRSHGVRVIADACGIPEKVTALRFEQQYTTGTGGNPANLDVVFLDTLEGALPTAIESKYTEPCTSKTARPDKFPFSDKYFDQRRYLWEGLPNAERLAKEINQQHKARTPLFRVLDATQLLKHGLALHRRYGSYFRLLYLYYDLTKCGDEGESISAAHKREVSAFVEMLKDDFRFTSTSYQTMFSKLLSKTNQLENHTAYREYVRGRYSL